MKFKSRLSYWVMFAILLMCILGIYGWLVKRTRGASIDPKPESEVEATLTDRGAIYKLCHGDLYLVNTGTGKWEWAKQLYDPDYRAKNYVERDGAIFRKAGKDELMQVKNSYGDDFEGATRFADLFDRKRGWTACELQSPKAPKTNDYVKLRQRILKGESDFIDNRIEPSGEIVHGGKTALKTVSVPKSRSMVTAKSSLSTELLHFVKGDDVWMSFWCHVPSGSGMPFTVLDLETTWLSEHPGMRIVISDGKFASFQLKWAGSQYYYQPKGFEVEFPKGKWVRLTAHLTLSEKSDGVIELWQDGKKIIDAHGQNLPLSHAIYNSLEVGISAYNEAEKTATLFVDDVSISNQPMTP